MSLGHARRSGAWSQRAKLPAEDAGDAAAPLVIGALSDRVGLSNAVLIMPGFVALSAVIWLAAAWKPGSYGRA